ncbi:unnamed protein product [Anisakis simplex]|uniref:CRAL-TRIO domain-containing protein n=1 Tax=Anisakis simplex TaxID=6269 RepID=A0A0M3JTI8_ANISI|nr:unnamed protein product [Anisakis simplex]
MDVQKQRSRLLRKIAFLPGSRDRAARPILVINAVCNEVTSQCDAHSGAHSQPNMNAPAYEDIVSLIGYLAHIPDERSRLLGFTVLIDGRHAHLKHLRNALRACQHALYKQIKQVVIIQPEKFLEQQKLSFDLIKEAYDFKTTLTSVHKLSKYVDITQLPDSLGGTFCYDPQNWIDLREKYENFIAKASSWIQTAKRHEKLALNESADSGDSCKTVIAPDELRKQGDELLDKLLPAGANAFNTLNSDWNSAAQKVELMTKQIKNVEEAPELEAKRAHQRACYRASMKLIDDHAQGIRNLVEWIFGAGEKWLLTLHEVGESADDSKQLVKDHVQLEAKSKAISDISLWIECLNVIDKINNVKNTWIHCIEVSDQADELCEMANRLIAEFPAHAITLENNREQMREVTNRFCCRVQRQKHIAMQSVRFHQLLNECSRKTDILLESLCTEVKAGDAASAEKERVDMESKVDEVEKIYHKLMENGVSFIDELCIDESNSSGRAVARDYSAGIVHVRERLEETRERRRRCHHLVDMRRLKIQQLLQLYTCEKDGEQAIKWIDELHNTLVNDYDVVERNNEALKKLREDRTKLEETARSTYEYGKQLCQVALVLRRSLRMDVQPQLVLNQRLESVWGAFCRALSDNEAKLNISDAFHATIKEVSNRLDELCFNVNEHLIETCLSQNKHSFNLLNSERKSLANDTRELKHIAEMLVANTDEKGNRYVYLRIVCRRITTLLRLRQLNTLNNRVAKLLFSEFELKTKSQDRTNKRNAADEIRYKLANLEEKQRKLEKLWMNSICTAATPSTTLISKEGKNSADNNHNIDDKNTSDAVTERNNSTRDRHVRIAPNAVRFDSSQNASLPVLTHSIANENVNSTNHA